MNRAAAAALVVLAACRGDTGSAPRDRPPLEHPADAVATWSHVVDRGAAAVPPAPSLHLDAAVAAQRDAGGAASEQSLVELETWASASGGLPAPAGAPMEVVPRGMTWLRMGEDLLADDRLRDRAAAPLLYLAHRMRAEGPTVFEVTLGQALALHVAERLPSSVPSAVIDAARRLAPSDAEVVRALAADAVFSVHLAEQATRDTRPTDARPLAAEIPTGDGADLRPEDVAALRAFHVALLAVPPGNGNRTAWLQRITAVAHAHESSPSIAVRRLAETLPDVAERMFRTVDEYAATVARSD